jgi:uracil-DNA glycosylase
MCADNLEQLMMEIRACTACVSAGLIPVARPVFRGRADHRFMMVGQAPAALGHERPAYAGPAGTKLRSWLAEAGFAGVDLLEDNFYLTSVTKCFPGPSISGKGDRAPSPAEIRLCAGHLEREIAFVRPELVVTLGKLAANVLIGPGSLTELVGTVGGAERSGCRFTVIPFPHPSGVSHWLNGEPGRTRLTLAIEQLREARERLGVAGVAATVAPV